MADFSYPQLSVTATNPSVGLNGTAAPTSSTEIGFISNGNLVGVSSSSPLPVSIDGDIVLGNVNIEEFGGTPVTIGQQLMAASMPVVIASNQSAIPSSQSGSWTIAVNNFPATQAVTQSTSPWVVSGTVTANAGTGTFAISAASLPLPTGASTSALQSNVQSAPGTPQTTAITIQGNSSGIAVPISGTVTTTNNANGTPGATPPSDATYVGGLASTSSPSYSTGNLEPLSLTLAGALRTDSSATTQPVSGTVTVTQTTASNLLAQVSQPTASNLNATVVQAIASNLLAQVSQPTASNLNATIIGTTSAGSGASSGLVTIQGNASGTPVPVSGSVSTTAVVNTNATFSGSLSVTTTESYTAAPTNAVGVVFEAESGNATNIRWGVSNSATNILSTTSGVLMEPGRSIDYLPIGYGTYLHYISTASGSNVIDIQWVKSS
jgi:hypothetical protein